MFNKKTIIHFLGICIVYALASYVSFGRALTFTFSKDDWLLLWGSLHNIRSLDAYWIHPATIAEAFIFSHLFGNNPMWWMVFGYALRVATAYALFLFVYTLTKSKLVAFLSGLFFASCYAGLETIGFVSAHAGSIALFFLILSLYYFIKMLHKEKSAVFFFLLFYFLGLLSDPGRIVPSLFLMPLLAYLENSDFFHTTILKTKLSLVVALVSVVVAGLLFIFFVNGSLMSIFLQKLSGNYLYIFQKLYLLGNYFAAIGNLLVGWVYPVVQDPQNTAMYSKIISRIGIVFVFFTIFMLGSFIKTKNRKIGIVAFFSLWIVVFYLTSWLFEPRAPMAGSHRYLLFSGVGFCVLVAYAICLVKEKWLIFIAAGLFIGINMYTASRILQYQQAYRSAFVVNSLWSQVYKDVPYENAQYIFIFSGQQPLLSQAIELSSGAPFALENNITDKKNFPLFIHDIPTALAYLCRPYNPIPLNHVFAWEVFSPHTLKSYTISERELLTREAGVRGCVLQ